ncbi:hypothetical protein [Rothia sp. ZJ932]|uniref:hypothetical protein n=1 Tax=Rothia sp. ZJ932 TaxID=2810516 RepID=UPI0019684870|nr:hypothetical protein [Rothia sp. ZJ932]QRZ61675.1 hypothetical protein JR346_00550 [Rothia sp. ZJ932]
MKFLKLTTTAVATIFLTFGAVSPVFAQSDYEQNINYLVTSVGAKTNDYTVRTEVIDDLKNLSQQEGISVEQAAAQAVQDYQFYASSMEHESRTTANQNAEVASRGGRTTSLEKHVTLETFSTLPIAVLASDTDTMEFIIL